MSQFKSCSEIKKIEKACQISDNILQYIIKNIKKFKTEKHVADEIKEQAKHHNCKLAFKSIVSTGKNLKEIHHKPDNTKLKKGFVIIDLGVKYKGYCSDITRTIFLGKPTKRDKELYRYVKNANNKVVKSIKEGVKVIDLYKICYKELMIYKKKMKHALGHGVGRNVHEPPRFKKTNKLKPGMVVAVEPAIYLNNRAVRIEDIVAVTKQGCRILTKTLRRLIAK